MKLSRMVVNVRFWRVAAILPVLWVFAGQCHAAAIYWTDWNGTIQRCDFDGGNATTLVSGVQGANGIALDLPGGMMYWGDAYTGKVQRSGIDGAGVTDLSGGYCIRGVELDLTHDKLYWIDSGTDTGVPAKIRRADLDGSHVEDVVSHLTDPFGLALDVAGGKVYWTQFGDSRIRRANLDGTGVEDLITTGLGLPFGMALDTAAGKLYWADYSGNRIGRANLDGSAVEAIIDQGLSSPIGVALDAADGKLYFAEEAGWIARSNLDGTSLETVIYTGGPTRFVALDVPEPATLALLALGGLGLVRRRRCA